MSYDLTNQFISNTFGNLLQKTGSGGYLYDLKGNQIGDIDDAVMGKKRKGRKNGKNK